MARPSLSSAAIAGICAGGLGEAARGRARHYCRVCSKLIMRRAISRTLKPVKKHTESHKNMGISSYYRNHEQVMLGTVENCGQLLKTYENHKNNYEIIRKTMNII